MERDQYRALRLHIQLCHWLSHNLSAKMYKFDNEFKREERRCFTI